MTEPLSCPYCNARVAVTEPPAGQRVHCPRCGEAFPYRTGEGGRGVNGAAPTAPPRVTESVRGPEVPRRWSNGAIAALVLAGMGVMAVVGLIFALATQGERRGFDLLLPKSAPKGIPLVVLVAAGIYLTVLGYVLYRGWARRDLPAGSGPEPRAGRRRLTIPLLAGVAVAAAALVALALQGHKETPSVPPEGDKPTEPVRAVRPDQLAGLGYLPADTNVVAAVHVAEALQDAEGKKLLEPSRLGPLGPGLASIEKWTGLKPEQLDHLVFGLRVNDQLPQLTVVVRTRQPYRRDVLAAALHPSKPTERDNKPLYCFKLGRFGDAVLWCAGEQTLVLIARLDGAGARDMDAVPLAPRAGSEGLPDALQSFLKERLPGGAVAWVAGHLDQPETARNWLAFTGLPEGERNVLAQVRTFGAGLRLHPDVALSGAFQCADAESARALEEILDRQRGEGVTLKMVGPSAQADPKSNWLTFQAKADPEALLRLLPGGANFLGRR
jgi:hypothetical protein